MTGLVFLKRAIVGELPSFAAVGSGAIALCSLISFVLVAAGLKVVVGSILAYAIATVFGYVRRRTFTFGSSGDHSDEILRFLALNALGLALVLALPAAAIALLHADFRVEVIAACIAISISNNFALKRLFFRVAAITWHWPSR
jgi:putative flippase GtrA